MKIQIEGDQLTGQSGGGLMVLFGLPFFCVGLGVIGITIAQTVSPGSVGGDQLPLLFGLPFGGIFALVGAGIMLGRKGLEIDRRAGSFSTWWGLLVPFKRTDHPLDQFTAVLVTREIRRSDKSTRTVYPVRLGRSGTAVDIVEHDSMTDSRTLSETLSDFLQLPVEDASSGIPVRREVGTMNESIKERATRLGEAIEVPDAPADLRSVLTPHGQGLDIAIPPEGFSLMTVIPMIPVLLFVAFAGSMFLVPMMNDMKGFLGQSSSIMIGIFLTFFIALPLLAIGCKLIGAAFTKTDVEVNGQEIAVTTGWPIRKRKTIIAKQIEELFAGSKGEAHGRKGPNNAEIPAFLKPIIAACGKTGGVTVRSDELTLTFGTHLSPEESAYLAAMIRAVLVCS